MRESTQGGAAESSGEVWQSLERMVRGKVQEFIQEILEDEVTRFLGGRERSQRRESVEGAPRGYRNGYGKPRKLMLASGTIEVRRLRVRDMKERFESRVCRSSRGGQADPAALPARSGRGGLRAGIAALPLPAHLSPVATAGKSAIVFPLEGCHYSARQRR